MFVLNDAMTRTGFWTVDMVTGSASSATVTDHYAAAQLIGSGEEFAAFEGQASQAPGGAFEFARSGRVIIYDSATGKRLREFNKPELAGPGTVLCLSPAGWQAAYAQGRKVSLLDFRSGDLKLLGSVTDRPEPAYSGACGFTE